MSRFLDLLFPPRCVCCGKLCDAARYYGALCMVCGAKWKLERHRYASNERYAVPGTRWLLYLTRYTKGGNSVGSRMILGAKDRCRCHYLNFMAHELAAHLGRYLDFSPENTVIAYAPRRASARRRTGFDQSQMLGQTLGKVLHLPCLDALQNCSKVEQKGLTSSERIQNAQHAIVVRRNYAEMLRGKHVLLLDDIMTTGATAAFCAKALNSAGASTVDIIVIGRTPRRTAAERENRSVEKRNETTRKEPVPF